MGEGWEEVLGMQRGRLKSRVRGGDKQMKALAKDHSVRKEGLQELGYRRPSRWVGLQAGASGKQASLWNSELSCCLSHWLLESIRQD